LTQPRAPKNDDGRARARCARWQIKRVRRLAFLLLPAAGLLPALAHADDPPACNAWNVEYAIDGTLRISDTTMGAGDGVHRIGTGKLVVRYDNVGNQPGGTAKVVGYEMPFKFTVSAYVLGLGTTIVNESTSRTIPNACGVSAEGTLCADHALRWYTPWNGLHADGTQDCSGSMCGRMGAPPRGRSALHMPPHPVEFNPFVFSADLKTFRMPYVVTRRSSKDTAGITLEGRETRRTCVHVPPCP